MSTLLARLRAALAPHYSVESELAIGGMARVYRGFDRSLDRPVAIKVLRPELATARGAERFVREARLLAHLSHANVVAIHQVGEADGLFFYVMDFVEGETLRERLERGPLAPGEAVALGADLLRALEAVHGAGVVHRDVKPANVFLLPDRALLADFGVAKLVEAEGTVVTEEGERPGTPGYMAPEQLAGQEVTARADLYAAGMLLYEALAGRRWSSLEEFRDADWLGVPRHLVPVLRRALERSPARRWPDAGAFRSALLGAASRQHRARLSLLTGTLVALLTLLAVGRVAVESRSQEEAPDSDAPVYDVALLPCQTVPAADSAAGEDLARLAALGLEGLPMLDVVPFNAAARWWKAAQALGSAEAEAAALDLRARRVVRCWTVGRGDGRLEVRLELAEIGHGRRPLRVLHGPAPGPTYVLGDSVAVEVLRALLPAHTVSRESLATLSGHDVQAVRAFLLGEHAFLRNDRVRAERMYLAAAEADPTLGIALWRLADVRRWRGRPAGVDLHELRDRAGDALAPVDRLLLEAFLARTGPDPFVGFEEAVRRFPHDAYSLLIYADELFHRGALWGVSLDSVVRLLKATTELDPFLAPAWEHLVFAEIRRGNREAAADGLGRYRSLVSVPDGADMDLFHPWILELAFLERFEPDSARRLRPRLFGDSVAGGPDVLREGARFAIPYLDLPQTQLELGGLLLVAAGPDRAMRSAGHLTRALALFSLGREEEAMAELDAAAAVTGSPTAAVQAAEWRVVSRALGLGGLPDSVVEEGRRSLERVAGEPGLGGSGSPEADPALRARAAWALALLALREGEATELARWRAVLDATPEGLPAAAHVAAVEAVAAGDPEGGLERARGLVPLDVETRTHFPFLRTALHVARGEWELHAGRPEAAGLAWLWAESSDMDGEPGPFVKAGEIDAALRGHGQLLRARATAAAGRPAEACRAAEAAASRWTGADAGWAPLLEEARRRAAACHP